MVRRVFTDYRAEGDADTEGNAEAGSSGRARKAKGDAGDDELSNHDSEEDDEQDIRNLVLCQFEKV